MTDVLTPERVPTIHELMGRVLGDLPAIGKNQRNQQQGFNFRGIDDVLNALNPLLAKHGVFYMPDVIERISEERATRNGGVMYVVHLHVRYRFFGPAGDYIEASGWGEGTDSGDKATNKAMTGAMKYVLFQTFAISTEEASENDSDAHSPEETVGRRSGRNTAQTQEGGRSHGTSPGVGDAMTSGGQGASTSASEAPAAACELCGSTRSDRVVVRGETRCAIVKGCKERQAGAPDA